MRTGRRWHVALMVAAALTFAVLGGVTAKLYDSSQQHHAEDNYQPAGKPGLVHVMSSKAIPKGYEPHCQNPQSQGDSDLCSQWAAVEQATEANRLSSLNLKFAIFSLWATFIGTLLLVWTLIETRQTSRRELRAYVSVHPTSLQVFKGGAEGMEVGLEIKNGGSTPAYSCGHAGNVVAMTMDEAKAAFSRPRHQRLGEKAPYVLHAGQQLGGASIESQDKFTREEMLAISQGDVRLFTYGLVEYVDVFDRERESRFCYFLAPESAPAMGVQVGEIKTGIPIPMNWEIAPFHNTAD